MGKRGPAREPTKLRLMRGDPGHRGKAKNEPVPTKPASEPPAYLEGVSLEKWNSIFEVLEPVGILTAADVDTLGRYCVYFEEFRKCVDAVRKNGNTYTTHNGNGTVKAMHATPEAKHLQALGPLMLRIESEFGMTPSSRASIDWQKPSDDPLDSFLSDKTG